MYKVYFKYNLGSKVLISVSVIAVDKSNSYEDFLAACGVQIQ